MADHKHKDQHSSQEKTNKPSKPSKLGSLLSFSNRNLGRILGKKTKSKLLHSFNRALDNYQKHGLISAEEKKMVKNIINIDDMKVDDVMTPRTDIIAVKNNASLDEIKKIIIDREHSRIPVYKQNLDSIVGFIHSKDLAKFIGDKSNDFKIHNIIRKILYVPHSMRIIDLLLRMRSSRVHIAIVLDEYGGTDGLVTIEDIMEEIVGEIEDEHDIPDDNIYLRIKKINDNVLQVGGRVEIDKIIDFLPEKIFSEDSQDDFDTVGGLVFDVFKKVPEVGEVLQYNPEISFKILDADARSVKLVEITKSN